MRDMGISKRTRRLKSYNARKSSIKINMNTYPPCKLQQEVEKSEVHSTQNHNANEAKKPPDRSDLREEDAKMVADFVKENPENAEKESFWRRIFCKKKRKPKKNNNDDDDESYEEKRTFFQRLFCRKKKKRKRRKNDESKSKDGMSKSAKSRDTSTSEYEKHLSDRERRRGGRDHRELSSTEKRMLASYIASSSDRLTFVENHRNCTHFIRDSHSTEYNPLPHYLRPPSIDNQTPIEELNPVSYLVKRLGNDIRTLIQLVNGHSGSTDGVIPLSRSIESEGRYLISLFPKDGTYPDYTEKQTETLVGALALLDQGCAALCDYMEEHENKYQIIKGPLDIIILHLNQIYMSAQDLMEVWLRRNPSYRH